MATKCISMPNDVLPMLVESTGSTAVRQILHVLTIFYTFCTKLLCLHSHENNVYYKLKVASKFLAVLDCTLDFKCLMDADGQNKRLSGIFF